VIVEHPVVVARREAARLQSTQLRYIDEARSWLREHLAELEQSSAQRQQQQLQTLRDMGRLQALALAAWKQVGKAARAEERFAESEEFERAIAAQERKQVATLKYTRAVVAARKAVAELWSLFQADVSMPRLRANTELEFAALLRGHIEAGERGLRKWNRITEQQLSTEEMRVEKTQRRTHSELAAVAADFQMLLQNQTGVRDAIESLAGKPIQERAAATAELREVRSEIEELEARLALLRKREHELASTVDRCDKRVGEVSKRFAPEMERLGTQLRKSVSEKKQGVRRLVVIHKHLDQLRTHRQTMTQCQQSVQSVLDEAHSLCKRAEQRAHQAESATAGSNAAGVPLLLSADSMADMASYYAVADAAELDELSGARIVVLEQEVTESDEELSRLVADAAVIDSELAKLGEESQAAAVSLPRLHEQKRLAAKEHRFRAAQELYEQAKQEEATENTRQERITQLAAEQAKSRERLQECRFHKQQLVNELETLQKNVAEARVASIVRWARQLNTLRFALDEEEEDPDDEHALQREELLAAQQDLAERELDHLCTRYGIPRPDLTAFDDDDDDDDDDEDEEKEAVVVLQESHTEAAGDSDTHSEKDIGARRIAGESTGVQSSVNADVLERDDESQSSPSADPVERSGSSRTAKEKNASTDESEPSEQVSEEESSASASAVVPVLSDEETKARLTELELELELLEQEVEVLAFEKEDYDAADVCQQKIDKLKETILSLRGSTSTI